jgi:hypothetical protein
MAICLLCQEQENVKLMPRFYNAFLIAAAVIVPVAVTPAVLRAEDHVYHDKAHNEDHHWDDREDHAYRMWVKENHRKYKDFAKLKAEDQQSYWNWRHDHSDAQLNINIK